MTTDNSEYQLLNNKFVVVNFSVLKLDNNQIVVSYSPSIFKTTENGTLLDYDYTLVSNNFNFNIQKLISNKLKSIDIVNGENQDFLNLMEKANKMTITIDMNNNTLDSFEQLVYNNIIQFYSSLTTDITFSLYDYDRNTGVFSPII